MALPIIIGVLSAVLVLVLVWLVFVIARAERRLLHTFRALCSTFDDMRRALQSLNERARSAEGALADGLRRTHAALEANGRALGDIREALEAMKRR